MTMEHISPTLPGQIVLSSRLAAMNSRTADNLMHFIVCRDEGCERCEATRARIAAADAEDDEERAAYERGWNAGVAASGGSPLLYLRERDTEAMGQSDA